MTIACVLVHNREVWLGSDRQTTLGNREKAYGPPKWVLAGDRSAAVACAGQGLAGNLIRENAGEIFKSASTREVWQAVTACFKKHGWEPHVEGDNPPAWDVDLLYATRDSCIFHIARNGNTRWVTDSFYATGSGDPYALGAFHALQPTDADARTRVLAAVTAACRYDLNSGGEPWVEQL